MSEGSDCPGCGWTRNCSYRTSKLCDTAQNYHLAKNAIKNIMKLIVFCRILLLLLPASSLSTSSTVETRTSVLRSWGGGKKLGWIQERRPTESDVTEVLIGWEEPDNDGTDAHPDGKQKDDNHHDIIAKVLLQEKRDVDSLSSSLWPAALAGSILLRSPLMQAALKEKTVLELGSGLGLAGLVAATAPSKRCILTERDEDAIDILEETAQLNRQNAASSGSIESLTIGGEIEARKLEWRDDHTQTDLSADVVMGTDIAYYHYLLRPLIDTTQAHLNQHHEGLFYVVGPANREAMWELYHNIKDGCYNQLTDENEQPWPGMTSMLLYELSVGSWITDSTNNLDDGMPEETVPIATLMHATKKGLYDSLLGDNDHIATVEDEENQMISF